MSKNVQLETIKTVLERGKSSIAMAIPSSFRSRITADGLLRLAYVMAMKNPELQKCDPVSIGASVREAAMLGLQFDGLLGHGALVPRFNSKLQRMTCQFQIGYKGLLALAWRSGSVESVDADSVHEGDVFVYRKGLTPVLDHEPKGVDRSAKTLTHAWACIRFKGGGFVFKVLTKNQLEAIKLAIRGWDKGLWNGPHYPAMCIKTALRAVCKLVDLSVDDQRIIAKDEVLDADPAALDDEPTDGFTEAQAVIPEHVSEPAPQHEDEGQGAPDESEDPGELAPPTASPPVTTTQTTAAAIAARRRKMQP